MFTPDAIEIISQPKANLPMSPNSLLSLTNAHQTDAAGNNKAANGYPCAKKTTNKCKDNKPGRRGAT